MRPVGTAAWRGRLVKLLRHQTEVDPHRTEDRWFVRTVDGDTRWVPADDLTHINVTEATDGND